MTAALLALLTALSYGVANYLGALMTRRHPLGGVLLTGQAVGLAGAGVLLAVEGGGVPGTRPLVQGLLAGLCNGVALAALYTAAAAGPISLVSPIGATGAVVPVVVALATGERPAVVQLLGVPLAVAGVVLAAARDTAARGTGARDTGARGTTAAVQAAPRTVVLAVLSALAFGGFLTLFGEASHAGSAWAVLTSRTALVTGTAAVLALRRPPLRVPPRALPAVALPGLLLFVGTVSYGVATTKGLVSVVAVLATLSPVVTVGLAVVLLREHLAPRQRVGVATALVGVVLLALG